MANLPSVLMVDDVEANLIALEATLSHLPCELIRARSGNEALKRLLERDFAVVLLDVQMPEMDGYEVARYARDNPATAHIPIIFLTAMNPSEEGALRGYGSGAVDFVFKPVNAHILRGKVAVFVSLFNERRRLSEEILAHKRTLDELERVNNALRHFTRAASHDLRSPLTVMTGFLDLLKEELGEGADPTALQFLERCRGSADRMRALLDSLLAYAGLKSPSAWTEMNAGELAQRAVDDLQHKIQAAGAKVTIDPLPNVRGDANRLYQLFLNLIGNAVKFARDGVPLEVHVSAETKEGHAPVFCVEDNGIGIPEKHLAKIFEAFGRVHGKEVEGTGLGLSICRDIVEQHGGRIWVDSKVGEGSSFLFTFGV